MKTIRFAFHYNKMPRKLMLESSRHRVIGVFKVQMKALPKDFIAYDTVYYDKIAQEKKYFPLRMKTGLVIVIFSSMKHSNGELLTCFWSTIRKCTAENLKKYKSMVGKPVIITVGK